MARLAALFALDAFAGGFVIQSIVAYWFATRFGLLDRRRWGRSSSARTSWRASRRSLAAPLAARFGLINTMVFTHLPSNVLLILVPLMPTAPLAIAVLLAPVQHQPDGRADPPVVHDGRRRPGRALGRRGVTGIARSVGAAVSPSIAAPLVAGWVSAACRS